MQEPISLIIPTYNEERNIVGLIRELADMAVTNNLDMEIIIVDDDSADGTVLAAKTEFVRYKHIKWNIIIRKLKKRSLSLSVIEGIEGAGGTLIGVMDADFSHPPSAIPKFIKAISDNDAGLVIGSRYIKGGGIIGWPIKRRISSWVACALARPLTSIKDASSGFFFFRRTVIKDTALLNPVGFKIGLEILVKGDYKKVIEIPYTFIERRAGSSKFNSGEIVSYVRHLTSLYLYIMIKNMKRLWERNK